MSDLLVFEEVHFSYRLPRRKERVLAVDGVSVSVAPGELVAIYGENGAGKSTLLYLAATMLVADRGRVLFDGRDLARLKTGPAADYRRDELGFVMQDGSTIPAPAAENAALKLTGTGLTWRQAVRQVEADLEELGLDAEMRKRKPEELSKGQRQRIEIARAFSLKPRLLLADEPTSNLDSKASKHVLSVLRGRCDTQGVAAMVVTHDPAVAAFADRKYVLRDGNLRAYEQPYVSGELIPSEQP